MSRNPSVTSSAVSGPLRSITAFVTTVVACTSTSVTAAGLMPALFRTASTAVKNATSRLLGVVSVLSTQARPLLSRSTTSVNVPPISTAIAKFDIQAFGVVLRDGLAHLDREWQVRACQCIDGDFIFD